MARPKKQGMEYFPHDTDASNDVKLESIIYLYGAEGYAFYFLHLEYIYREDNFMLNISDAETKQILCRKLNITEQKYESILNSCLKKGLFDLKIYEEKGVLTSSGIQKRAEKVREKRQKMAEKYKKTVSGIVSASETGEETTAETRQSKVKKSKVNISTNVDIKPPLSPLGETDGLSPYLKEKTTLWLNYKKERKQTYKTMGLKALLQKIGTESKTHGEQTVGELIELTIANNWQGIPWDRLEKTGGQASGRAEKTCENEYAELNLGTRL